MSSERNESEGAEKAPSDRFSMARRACDYIAGMTDRYAMAAFVELFVPSEWGRVEAELDLRTPPYFSGSGGVEG
jgi:hypothetical protein